MRREAQGRALAVGGAVALVAGAIALGGSGGSASDASAQAGQGGTLAPVLAQIRREQARDRRTIQAAVRRSNEALRRANAGQSGPAGLQGLQGPQGPQGDPGGTGPRGAPGPKGSDATIQGVAAGGALTGTYPAPGIAQGAVGADALAAAAVSQSRLAFVWWTGWGTGNHAVPANSCSTFGGGFASPEIPVGALTIQRVHLPFGGPLPEGLYLPVTTTSRHAVEVLICNRTGGSLDTGPVAIFLEVLTP
jgi:hypothetical protein